MRMTFHWFEGTVADAVLQVKADKASLVVFVAAEDKASQDYGEKLKKANTTDKLVTALRIQADSVEHNQLREIYKYVPVPCVLIIAGDSGKIAKRFDLDLTDKDVAEFDNALPVKAKKPVKVETLKKRALPKCEDQQEDATPNEPKKARIQLKMLSGESASCIMNPDDSLRLLREKAASAFSLSSPFELAVSYPRRILNREQNSSTLEELALCPTSTVLILPQNAVASLNVLSTLTGFIQMFFTYVQQLWHRLFA